MRWIFLTLLLLNVLVFTLQWADFSRAPGVAPQSAPDIGANALVLLREATPEQRARAPSISPQRAAKLAQAPGAADQGNDAPLCLMVGPAGSELAAQQVLAAFRDVGIDARLVTTDTPQAPDFWVYLPPLPSREAAIRRLRELQQDMKVDSFLISRGPLMNGISLGLFKNREAAEALQQERVGQGLDARMTEVERQGVEHWVATTEPADVDLIEKVTQLMGDNQLPGERRQIFCKSVATGNDIP